MIDIHAHILPNIDDGPKDLDHALKMAKTYEDTGVTTVAATPHFIKGCYEVEKADVIEATNNLNEAIKKENINLKILPGMEVEICPEIPDLLKEDKILTINNKGKYLLIELPFHSIPSYLNSIFYELKLMGITPILAHPERNAVLGKNVKMIYDMVTRGVLMQVNAGSILGYFGKEVKGITKTMLECNMVHAVAGDAHTHEKSRGPCVHLTKVVLEKLVGVEKTKLLTQQVPMRIVNGGEFDWEEPILPRKSLKSFLGKVFLRVE